MNIEDVFKELGLTTDQLEELTETLKTNPMAAMGLIQKFKIPPESLQKMMAIFMSNPQMFTDFAEKAGISSDVIDTVKGNLDKSKD